MGPGAPCELTGERGWASLPEGPLGPGARPRCCRPSQAWGQGARAHLSPEL